MSDDDQTQGLVSLLKTLIRFSSTNNRAIEKELGFSGGYLSRLLSGKIEIKIQHILAILKLIELEPHEFFSMAFPADRKEPSPLLRHLQRVMPQLVPSTMAAAVAPASPSVDVKKLQKAVEEKSLEAIRRAFAEVAPTRNTP